MSLAATTSTTLTLIDAAGLKPHATTYDSQRIPVLATPKAHAWSPDNTILYIVSSDAIHAFFPASSTFTNVFQSSLGFQPVLVSRDKSTLIFAQGSTIHLLAVSSTSPKIAGSLTGHPAPVTSLSLSNDASLLASTSASGTLHVHNLAHNSHAVMKGFPSGPSISAKNLVCCFHPHGRTRLLVGSGKTLVVYDTTRPSGPVKSIPITEKEKGGSVNVGNVVAISCSPFSKTLVAVACTSGYIGLVDLEKEKPLFKTLHVKVPVSSMTFTSDGSSIALGTENGKVIVQDLRSMEKDPRTLLVGQEGKGECVLGLAVQKRIKSSSSSPSVGTTRSTATTARLPASLSVPLSQQDLNNATGAKSPARRVVSSSPSLKGRGLTVTPVKGRARKEEPPKRVFSPPKVPTRGDDIGDISIQIETLMGGGAKADGKEALKPVAGKEQQKTTKPRLSASRTTASSVSSPSLGRVRSRMASGMPPPDRPSSRLTVDSRPGSRKSSIAELESPAEESTSGNSRPQSLQGSLAAANAARPRTRTISRSSDVPSILSPQTDPASSGSVRDIASTIPPTSSASTLLTIDDQNRRVSATSTMRTARTPTPDLPSVDEDESPIWKNEGKSLKVTNPTGVLTTPDMERWVEAGKGRQHVVSKGVEKRVGWADSDGDDSPTESTKDDTAESDEGEPTISAAVDKGKAPALTHVNSAASASSNMEMSPIRRPHLPPGALQISPLRSSPLRGNTGGSGGHANGGAQELLRAVVKDVMYEYRQETKEDIKGLHLDLLRMGRSWKCELRTMMDEYVGDLRELREENVKLRKENDRLRRGF